MFQKNDNRTKKKLIYQYKTTIASYTKENNKLLSEIEDLKMTLNLNQDLLYQSISAKFGENEKIKNLINRSKALWKNNESLIEKKNNTEMEIDHLQKEMEQIPSKIQTEINNKNQIIDSVRTNKSISEENNFLINMGYNASIENEDKNVEYEEEEEEESEESSSDESSSSNERRTNKNKTKEFENLMEQLKNL